jgi:thiol peroxidase
MHTSKEHEMSDRPNAVTMQGNPLTLTGNEIDVSNTAPGFTLLDNDLKEKKMSDYEGKTLVVASVPSLDTSVCSKETRTFNERVGELPGDAQLLVVSMDLPFAQKRWVDEYGVDNLMTLSDHLKADFGRRWGVLVKELRLLARAVFVVDKNGRVVYREVVPEITDEPDYDAAIAAAKDAG